MPGTHDLDLDLASTSLTTDPYPTFAEARRVGRPVWSERQGMWLAYRHADADAVLRSRRLGRLWSSRWPEEDLPAFTLLHEHSLLENEPPVHTRLRRLVTSAFNRSNVARLRADVAAIADRLADELADAGSDGSPVDLMSGYAETLPVAVIGAFLGIPPEEQGPLRPWSNAIVKMYEYGVDPDQRRAAERAAAEYVGYVRELIAQRRSDPGPDMISSLVAVSDNDGTRLSPDELVATAVLLQMAGHEASVNVIGNGMLALFRHPGEQEKLLRDGSLIQNGVEELIRYDSPLQLFERTATADVELNGVRIEAGQKVAALLGSANRDPEVFTDPDRLDVGRAPNPHLGFGAGIHFCVGAPLARMEAQVSVGTLLRRFPALAPAGEPERRGEFVIRGLRRLPVTV